MANDRYLPPNDHWREAYAPGEQRPCPDEPSWPHLPGQERCLLRFDLPEHLPPAPKPWIDKPKPACNALSDLWPGCLGPGEGLVKETIDVASLGFLALRGGFDVLVRAVMAPDGSTTLLIQFVVFPYGFVPPTPLNWHQSRAGLPPGYGPGNGTIPLRTSFDAEYHSVWYFPTSVTPLFGIDAWKTDEWRPQYSWRPPGQKWPVLFTPPKVNPNSLYDVPTALIAQAMNKGQEPWANLELRQAMQLPLADKAQVVLPSAVFSPTYGQIFATINPLLKKLIVEGDAYPVGMKAIPAIACEPFQIALDAPDGPVSLAGLSLQLETSPILGETVLPERIENVTKLYANSLENSGLSINGSWLQPMNGHTHLLGMFPGDAKIGGNGWSALVAAGSTLQQQGASATMTVARVHGLPPKVAGQPWKTGALPIVALRLRLQRWTKQ